MKVVKGDNYNLLQIVCALSIQADITKNNGTQHWSLESVLLSDLLQDKECRRIDYKVQSPFDEGKIILVD